MRRKIEGFKLKVGPFLFHIKVKRHGNATGVEIYIGRLNEAHMQNLKTVMGVKNEKQTY